MGIILIIMGIALPAVSGKFAEYFDCTLNKGCKADYWMWGYVSGAVSILLVVGGVKLMLGQ